MTTLGPFYPSSVVSIPNGGVPWNNPGNAEGEPDGNKATCNLGSFEGVTDLLVLTGYDTNVSTDATVLAVRFVVSPASTVEAGLFNPSTKDMIGVGEPFELSQHGAEFVAEDDLAPTPSQMNSCDFGLSISIYGQSGGTPEIESVSLYVDVV